MCNCNPSLLQCWIKAWRSLSRFSRNIFPIQLPTLKGRAVAQASRSEKHKTCQNNIDRGGSFFGSLLFLTRAASDQNRNRLLWSCSLFSCTTAATAGAPQLPLDGPPQRGGGVQGQYVYAVIMSQPTPEVLQGGVKQLSDFDRVTFRELIVQCRRECDVPLVGAPAPPPAQRSCERATITPTITLVFIVSLR